MGARFAEKLDIIPILAPVSTTDGVSDFIDASQCHWMTFLLQVGSFTTDSADTVSVTVEASTATSTNATTISLPFRYRLSAAVGTDTQGAITSVSTGTDGVTLDATADDNKMLIIDVDPSVIPNHASYTNHRYVALTWDCAAIGAIFLSAVAILEPRYPGNDIPDVT